MHDPAGFIPPKGNPITLRRRALLVYPRFGASSFWNYRATCEAVGARYSATPLGLITVAALLPPHWEVRLVDRNVRDLRDEDLAWADLVLTGGMLPQQRDTLEVIALARAAGKPSVVGGPDVTASPAVYSSADFQVRGEAEEILATFVSDFEGGAQGGSYVAHDFPDVKLSPLPRFDLLELRHYMNVGVQFSRGCPFDCEFCNVVELNGRRPRTKNVDQILRELDALHALGYRGHVDFVDDNLIGNRKATKPLLVALAAWLERRGHPFEFSTEATINLADDDELLALMRAANFFAIFVGIETPDPAALLETHKLQNTRRNIADSIRKIHRAGIFVNAGFIIGFDAEHANVADAMVACIGATAIPVCMVGLLYALPGTRLARRLATEERLHSDAYSVRDDDADQCTSGLNFETRRARAEMLLDYRTVLERIYAPAAYFDRVRRVCRELDRSAHRLRVPFRHVVRDLRAFGRIAYRLGWLDRSARREFWGALVHCALHNPGAIKNRGLLRGPVPAPRPVLADPLRAARRADWDRPARGQGVHLLPRAPARLAGRTLGERDRPGSERGRSRGGTPSARRGSSLRPCLSGEGWVAPTGTCGLSSGASRPRMPLPADDRPGGPVDRSPWPEPPCGRRCPTVLPESEGRPYNPAVRLPIPHRQEGPMSRKVLLALVLAVAGCHAASPISQGGVPGGAGPAGRSIDWTRAGVVLSDGTRGIPRPSALCATVDATAGDAQPALQAAIDACPAGQVVMLSPGTYTLVHSLTVDHAVVIRGAGPTSTHIVENGGNIIFSSVPGSGGLGGEPFPRHAVDWVGGYAQGTTSLTLADASGLKVGQSVVLDQLNDTLVSLAGYTPIVNETGSEGPNGVSGNDGASRDGLEFETDGTHEAPRGLQQLVRVTAVTGNSVTIDPPLYYPHLASLSPQAFFWDTPDLEYAGIEDLHIDAQYTSGAVMFTFCRGCWAKGLEIDHVARGGVWAMYTSHLEVRDSYFYLAEAAAPTNYGVEIDNSSAALVENNIFDSLTASVLFGCSASGTVVGYNYVVNPAPASAWLFPGLSAHCAHSYMDLWEGNSAPNLILDVIHGSSSHMTVFRNRLSGFKPAVPYEGSLWSNNNIPIVMQAWNRFHSVVGNVLGTEGVHTSYACSAGPCDSSVTLPLPGGGSGGVGPIYVLGYFTQDTSSVLGYDALVPATLLRWGNYDYAGHAVRFDPEEIPGDAAVPTTHDLPASLYLGGAPSWFGSAAWPPIGPDVPGYATANPAQRCYETHVLAGAFDPAACY